MTVESAHLLNPNDLWTIGIAAYAAVISTFVLGWDGYKWLASGPKIDVSLQCGMKLIGRGGFNDPESYIVITAFNVGDRPTTITNMGGMYFDSWWRAYITRRKPKEAFIITEPSQSQRIPYRFEVGDQWIGMAEQDDKFIQNAKNGYMFFILYTVGSGKGHRARLTVKD